jgi:DUF1680 family protein
MQRLSRRLVSAVVPVCFASMIGFFGVQRVARERPDVARPLPLSAVRLTGGPLKHAQDLDAKYLLALEPDRMLAFYRKRAGLAPKAPPYEGWDGDGRNLTGHIGGHYLSAVSLMWAATGDPRFKARADYIVSELEVVQDKHGDGFLGAQAGARETFAELSKGTIKSAPFDLNGLWVPWYTLHKTFAGLRDAYRHTGNRTALEIETKLAGWAERVLVPLGDEQMQRMLNTEFGGMNEVLADLYFDTGDKRWLALSRRFEHRAVLDPLKAGVDKLDGLHGNTNVPKLVGSAVRYGYAADETDRAAATFFWDRVVRHHTFATGGHGKDEHFREPDLLSHIIDGRTSESCNVYNMLKLTRRLFALQPDSAYAEFQERALFNHVLGSIDPADGSTCYMVPVGRGVAREYHNMAKSFTCCVGTGMESHALHGDGIYYESGDRLWVNLYVPSTAAWESAGVRMEMSTDFPEGESAALKVNARAPRAFTLTLRRPAWAAEGFRVAVNGTAVQDLPAPGAYVELQRTWKTGDVIALTLPKTLREEPLRNDPRRVAILWGPLVLAGDLGPQPKGDPETHVNTISVEAPTLVASGRPVNEWVKPRPERPGSFRTVGVGRERDVELLPFYRLHRRVYAAYWDRLTQAEYDAKVAEAAVERERQRKLELASVTVVPVGQADEERRFNQQGEDTSIVRADGRPSRGGKKWFSYDIPVASSGPLALVVTYNSDARRPRSVEILVDGTRIGEQTLGKSSVSRFFDVEYPIPMDLLRGKERATVRFQASGGNEIPPIFALQVIRADADQ